MNLDAFLHNLHFDVDKVRPPDLDVDWEDAPLPYKLYRGLPFVPLSSQIPLSLEGQNVPVQPNLCEISHLLWYVYGITQYSESVVASDSVESSLGLMHAYRRYVPSGGALYPNELYVYLKLEDLPIGIYHYDVAHHRLVLLRAGNYDSYLTRALGNRCELSACFGIVFVTTLFWKNFFKYYNFAYRLQGLDAGVLIGQLLEVSKRYGYESCVYFQFLDRAVNHLLGLAEQDESVYAIIPLSIQPTHTWFKKLDTARWGQGQGQENGQQDMQALELCRELSELRHDYYLRSRNVTEYPMVKKMNEASRIDAWHSCHLTRSAKYVKDIWSNEIADAVILPRVKRLSYDYAAVCRKRFSPGMDFQFNTQITKMQLATVLQEATAAFAYRNDIDEDVTSTNSIAQPRVTIYGCLYHVDGIPDGAYQYDSRSHTLLLRNAGDHRFRLQEGMSMHNVNLFQVPICLHVAGARDHLKTALGYRGYRIQQMEAGMLIQRLLIAASALDLGGHPLLGFEASVCDTIYNMDAQEKTSLIQLPIGSYRSPPRLLGSLIG